jgi:hypothetical protein
MLVQVDHVGETMKAIDFLRAAGHTLLPEEGGWVTVKGNPFAPRGMRIPRMTADAGVQHLDVYWGFEERMVTKVGYSFLDGISAYRYLNDRRRKIDSDEKLRLYIEIGDEIHEHLENWSRSAHYQTTLITIATPYPDKVCFYNGELVTMSDELRERCLNEGLLETVTFGQIEKSPIVDEALRDIVDSLQVDGMMYHEANNYALKAGILGDDGSLVIPKWFYRPIGAYKEMFVEDNVLPPMPQ